MHLSRQWNCWSLRCSWSIACRRCSNYIFILNLTPGLNGLGKDDGKTRREIIMFGDSVHLILENWWYFNTPGITRFHQQWIWKLSAPFSVTFYQDSAETNWELGGDRKLVPTVLSGRCYIYADDATNWSPTEIQHHRHKYYPVRHVCLRCADAACFYHQIWLHIMDSSHFQNHKSRGVLELIKMSWNVSGSEGMRVAQECRRAKFASRLVRRALLPP